MKQWAQLTSYKNEAEQQTAGILYKIIVATGIGFLFGALVGIYYHDVQVIATLSLGIIMLIVPYVLLRRGQVSAASIILALLAIGTLTASAMAGQGINDLAIVAFPIIYFFASVSLNRTVFRICLTFTLLAIFWLVFGDLNGWFVPQPFPPTDWVDFLIVAVVLGVAAFASDLLANSLRKNLERAEHEISARQQAEEKLLESEERFKALHDASSGGVIIHDKGLILDCNQGLSDMTGFTNEELVGMDGLKLITPDWLDLVLRNIKSGHDKRYEVEGIRKDGSIYPLSIKGKNVGYKGRAVRVIEFWDITERKQAEELFVQAKGSLEKAQSSANIGNWEMDPITKKLIWSKQMFQILEVNPDEEPSFELYYSRIHPDDLAYVQEVGARVYADNEAAKAEYRLLMPSGSIKHIATEGNREFEGDEVVKLTGIVQDITKRKQAEEALRESEEQFKLVMRQSPNVFELYDLDGLQIEVNEAYEKLWGFPASHTVNKFNVLKSKEVIDTGLITSVQKAYAGENVDVGEYQFNPTGATEADGPGRARWLKTTIYPLKDSQDRVKNIVITHEDVTERKLAEEALRKSEAIQSKMVANIGDVLVIIDQNGINQYKSPNVTTLFGWQPEELVGNSVWDTVHPDDLDSAQKFLAAIAMEPDTGGTTELRYKRKDAMYVWIEITVLNLLSDPDIKGFLGNYHDITERKLAEEQRISLEAQLRQSQKLEAVGTMVGGISHEFNNVLQSLFLYGGLVQDELPDNETLRSNFQHMLDDGNRARDLIKQILTFSRGTKVEMKPQPLHELTLEVLVLERASLPASIDIKTDIDMNCGMVFCDKTQISQIIMNLCNNAQHAMEEKGGTLTVSLQQTQASMNNGDPKTDVLELIVSDTGHGIDAPDLEKIFDPFFTTKQVGEGTGLGLSVIHGIVEMMKGQISVTSKRGKGTTFRILFPVTEVVSEDNVVKPTAAVDVVNKSILLVDDEDSIRLATQAILTRKGFTVDSASDGEQALELFKSNPNKYDLIVTDQSMPKMSGIDLTKAIRNAKAAIPIMLSTGQLGVADEKEFKDIGITAFIQKPWTAKELIERIRELDDN